MAMIKRRYSYLVLGVIVATSVCCNSSQNHMRPMVLSTFNQAIADNNIERVKELLSAGAELEPKCPANAICKPLAFAAARGRLEIVKLLLEAGADPNGKNAYGDTPFMVAENAMATDKSSEADVRKLRRFLLENGTDPNQPNDFGISPLIGMCGSGDKELVQVALKHGGDVNATFVRRVDSKHGDRNSALMWAAGQGEGEIVRMLLDAGANPSYTNSIGESATDWAKANGHDEIAEILLSSVKSKEK
jgi:ankyrin repeat protein